MKPDILYCEFPKVLHEDIPKARFLARYRAYVIASKFFVVDTITFERINRLTSNFAHVETEQK